MPQRKIRAIVVEYENGHRQEFTVEDIQKAKEWQSVRSILRELKELQGLENLL